MPTPKTGSILCFAAIQKQFRMVRELFILTPDIVRASHFARGLPAESGSGGALLRDGLTDLAL